MLLNFEDTLKTAIADTNKLEQILGTIVDQKYSLKVGSKILEEKLKHAVS